MGVRLGARDLGRARSSGGSRAPPGAAAARRCPGKLLWKVDPGALDALAAPAARRASRSSRRRTARRRRARWLARDPRRRATGSPGTAPARTSSRASPPRSLAARDAELGLFEVDEAALPEVMRRVAPARRLARQPLPRPARPLRRARAHRRALARGGRRAPRVGHARRQRRRPARRASSRTGGPARCASASTTRASPGPALQHAADSKYCVRCGAPYDVRGRLRRPPRRLPLPGCGHARPPLDVAARDDRAARPRRRRASTSSTPAGTARVRAARCPASTTSTTRSPPRRSRSRSARRSTRSRRASGASRAAFGRFERIAAGDRRRPDAADQEPGRRERGGPHAAEGGVPADARDRAQRRDRRRPRRLLDLGRRLRAARSTRVEPLVATGERAAELALRFTYGGFARERLEVDPRPRAGARPRPRARRRPAASSSSSPPTRRCSAARDRRRRAASCGRTGRRRAMRIRVAHLYPDYLNIYADRGNIAVLARRARAARPRARRDAAIGLGDAARPGALRPALRRRRPGPRAGADRARPRRDGGDALAEARRGGAALLAVCGGYQLLGRGYRGRDGSWMPGAGCFPLETRRGRAADDRRRAARVRARRRRPDTRRRLREPRRPDAARRRREPLGRVVAGFGNDGASGFEGCRVGARDRHVPPRPAAAAEPVARRLAARPGARARGRDGRAGAALRRARAARARRLRRARPVARRPPSAALSHANRRRRSASIWLRQPRLAEVPSAPPWSPAARRARP